MALLTELCPRPIPPKSADTELASQALQYQNIIHVGDSSGRFPPCQSVQSVRCFGGKPWNGRNSVPEQEVTATLRPP